MKVVYSSNNSGGSWWLHDDDWKALEESGWVVEWMGERFLGALATEAYIDNVSSVEEAIETWEAVTGGSASDVGCECCGPPHSFYEA